MDAGIDPERSLLERKVGKFCKITYGWGNRSRKVIIGKIKVGKFCKITYGCWDRSRKIVIEKIKVDKFCKITYGCWDKSRKVIIGKIKVGKFCKITYRWGNRSIEEIGGQVQNRELRQVCKVELIQGAFKRTRWKGYGRHNLDSITCTMAVRRHSTAGNASPVTRAGAVAPCLQAVLGHGVIQTRFPSEERVCLVIQLARHRNCTARNVWQDKKKHQGDLKGKETHLALVKLENKLQSVCPVVCS
jgi:hypothetical protein